MTPWWSQGWPSSGFEICSGLEIWTPPKPENPQVPMEHCNNLIFSAFLQVFSAFLWWLSLAILHPQRQTQSIQCPDSSDVPFTSTSISPFSHHSILPPNFTAWFLVSVSLMSRNYCNFLNWKSWLYDFFHTL